MICGGRRKGDQAFDGRQRRRMAAVTMVSARQEPLDRLCNRLRTARACRWRCWGAGASAGGAPFNPAASLRQWQPCNSSRCCDHGGQGPPAAATLCRRRAPRLPHRRQLLCRQCSQKRFCKMWTTLRMEGLVAQCALELAAAAPDVRHSMAALRPAHRNSTVLHASVMMPAAMQSSQGDSCCKVVARQGDPLVPAMCARDDAVEQRCMALPESPCCEWWTHGDGFRSVQLQPRAVRAAADVFCR